jgi:DNA-binding GntR family transcriptional regulator
MPRGPVPPYLAVAAALRDRIDEGEWLPGEQLPSVRDLAKHYKVGVSTAQRAITVLSDEGKVTITPGWGVFRAES